MSVATSLFPPRPKTTEFREQNDNVTCSRNEAVTPVTAVTRQKPPLLPLLPRYHLPLSHREKWTKGGFYRVIENRVTAVTWKHGGSS